MKCICKRLAAVAITAGLGVSNAPAQEESPYWASFQVKFANQYLWRGFVANDSPSLQPELTIGYRGFSITSWSNFSRRAKNGQSWTEQTLHFAYRRRLGHFTGRLGWRTKTFPNLDRRQGKYTNEIYAGFSHADALHPSVTVHRDVQKGNGWYYYLSVGPSVPSPHGVSITPLIGLGINQHLFIPQTTISNLDLGLSIGVPLGPVSVSPFFLETVGHRSLFGHHCMYGLMVSARK